jgi:GntR family transcriptional regulator, phosphonate transport system regulatory protein
LADELSMNGPPADAPTRWGRIADAVRHDLGALAPGARLPTEAQLSTRFGVNRHTVRRAIEALSREGLVRVERGRGAFVADDVLDYAVGSRPRFSEWVRRHNREPSGRVLDLRQAALGRGAEDQAAAAALRLDAGAPVVVLERLGLADGQPVGLGRHVFPAARLPGLLDALRRHPTITAALRAAGVADYRRQSTRVTARLPRAAEATLLEMPPNRPLLISESINVDQDGSPVEFGIARYPTPRVQLVFEP